VAKIIAVDVIVSNLRRPSTVFLLLLSFHSLLVVVVVRVSMSK